MVKYTGLLRMVSLCVVLQGCASLPSHVERVPSEAIPGDSETPLGRIARQSVPADRESGFRPLPMAAWSMDARLTLARHARRSLDLQYYLLQNDVTGHTLLRAVRDAAGRGVRVRVLVDDLYTAQSDRMLLVLAAYPNVEVRLFNPFPAGRSFGWSRWTFALRDFARVNHRMHNKLFIADGVFAVAGGRNIADEYFFTSKDGNFVDFDLLVAGRAVPDLQAVYDVYWNSPRVYPLEALETSRDDPQSLRDEFEALTSDAKTAFPMPADGPDLLGYAPLNADIDRPPLKLHYGHVTVFADDPEKVSGRAERGDDRTTVTSHVIEAIGAARTSVLLGSPYFIPGKPGLDAMRAARERGVQVDVITNSLASNDEPFASAAYGRYRRSMLEMGVALYEADTSQLRNDEFIGVSLRASIGRSHAKLAVFDRQVTFVGSMNMDLRSSRENTELGMLVESPELSQDVVKLIERLSRVGSYRLRLSSDREHVEWVAPDKGHEAVYDDDPGVDLSTRLKIWLLFPFVGEGLL